MCELQEQILTRKIVWITRPIANEETIIRKATNTIQESLPQNSYDIFGIYPLIYHNKNAVNLHS